MEFKHEKNKIVLLDENENIVAQVSYVGIDDNTVDINKTYVDKELRGQKIADNLMRMLSEKLIKENKKAITTCSYADVWLRKNKDIGEKLLK